MAGLAGAHLAIGRVRRVAADVADRRGDDAGELPVVLLGAPEAAEREDRGSGAVGPRPGERRAQDAVRAGLLDGVGAAGEGPVGVRHLGRPEVVENAHVEILGPNCDAAMTAAPDGPSPGAVAGAREREERRNSGCQALPVEASEPDSHGTVLQGPPAGSIRYAEVVEPSSRHHQDLRRVGRPQPREEVTHRGPGCDHRPTAVGGRDPNLLCRRVFADVPVGDPPAVGRDAGTPLHAFGAA